MIDAITPGTTPSEKKDTAGNKYTNAGIVCIKSKIGVTVFLTAFLCAHKIPIGTPITTANIEAVRTRAKDCIEGPHNPRLSIKSSPITANKAMRHFPIQ
ncbi:hypothetical protein D3C71_1533950 [compost metagenome]